MKRFLLDTHAFLWFVSGSVELSNTSRNLIENDRHEIYFSIASLWEISIKVAIGKLQITPSRPFPEEKPPLTPPLKGGAGVVNFHCYPLQ